MRGRFKFVVIGVVAFLVLAVLFASDRGVLSSWAQNTPDKASSSYQPIGDVRKGVWNDGQAALWDLNILDHFHYFGPEERARGYQPQQPINFSHPVHVQKNKIECQFCHWSVAKSAYAAIPEVETCVGCHKYVDVPGSNAIPMGVVSKDPAFQAEIAKIYDYHRRGEPIPWVKVHVTPDYVKFNHKRHIKGGIACHQCHGQIPEMDVVQRVSSMKMGWCVSCHRAQGASIDCYTCHR